MNDEIIEKMEDAQQYDVTLVYKDGHKLKGFVDVYESRYDNDGEASICFAGEHGERLIVEEHELKDVIVDTDSILYKMSDAYEQVVTLVYKDGRKLKGTAVSYSSKYLNDDGKSKIGIRDEQGKAHSAYESELADVIIDE